MAKPPVPGRIRGRLYQKALKKSHSTPLRVYISGDNGCSAEGSINGTPNEDLPFNGVVLTAEEQMPWYDAWGSSQT
jgi:hypothetical protein